MEEYDPYEYLWDLHLGRCANKYFSITFPACQNRIEYHNRSYYKDPYANFKWTVDGNTWYLHSNSDLLAILFRTETKIDPKTTYMWYKD